VKCFNVMSNASTLMRNICATKSYRHHVPETLNLFIFRAVREATTYIPRNELQLDHHLLFSLALQLSAGYGLLVHEVSWLHTTTRHSRRTPLEG
jgi:hypothetical protein